MNSAGTKSQVSGILPRLLIRNELRRLTGAVHGHRQREPLAPADGCTPHALC